MSVKKPAIPQVDPSDRVPYAMKQILEQYQGLRGNPISQLSTTATTAQIIDKINELIELFQ